MKPIYDYSDYRLFLKDFIDEKKESNAAFSYRYLAQKAGISSSSYYSHVIRNNRNLSKNSIVKTCNALKLKKSEATYFENLVFFNQAKTVDEKNHYFETMVELRKSGNIKKIEEKQYDYFAKWHHCVIRELAVYLDWNNDYTLLGSYVSPKISGPEAKKSVELLLRLGFLQAENGNYTQSEPLLQSDDSTEFKLYRIIKFQIEMLKLAQESYSRFPDYRRMSSASTFSISNANLDRFYEILRESRQKLINIAEKDDNPEDTFMLNINLFPLTKTYRTKRG